MQAKLFNNVLVTGGAGYVRQPAGAAAARRRATRSRSTTPCYFGDDFLPKSNPNLTRRQGRHPRHGEAAQARSTGHDAVVSLACISNDASFELDEKLSTSINLDAFEPMVIAAKKAGVKRFVYASSSSVYGVSDSPT